MSTSLVHNELLYIGTYVDTLFIFSIKTFEKVQLIRTHDSVLSLCSLSDTENKIAVGQAGGYVDIITENLRFVHESYSLNKDAGYINKMVLSSSGKEIIMACEKGIYIQELNVDKTQLLAPSREKYLVGQLVS